MSNCPYCQKVLDAFLPGDNLLIEPRPGDYTICGYCFGVLTFDKDLKLHPAEQIPPDVAQARMALIRFKTSHLN